MVVWMDVGYTVRLPTRSYVPRRLRASGRTTWATLKSSLSPLERLSVAGTETGDFFYWGRVWGFKGRAGLPETE